MNVELSPDVKGFVHGYLRTADNPYEMVQIRATQGWCRSDVFGAALTAAADRDDTRVHCWMCFWAELLRRNRMN